MATSVRFGTLFISPAGWRAGPRFAAFVLLFLLLQTGLTKGLVALIHYRDSTFSPTDLLVFEGASVVAALLVSYALVRLERRRMDWFGFPLRLAFRSDYWLGMAFGAGFVSLLLLFSWLGNGVQIDGLAVHGAALWKWLAIWIAGMILVGFSEELQFRGYPLVALAGGIGFWPAAALLSVVFGAVHYFLKPMETVIDAASVTLLGLFMCFTLLRTGTLWFAIGFHSAFDFFALGLYGAPNTLNNGLPLAHHLLHSTFGGAEWLTGGPRGLEASWLVFPMLAVMFGLVHWRYPHARFGASSA
jgi:membrane protease YdiL (CAAX protease family)